MRALLLAATAFAFISVATAKDLELDEMLIVAKFAGYCGAIQGMVALQDSTDMPGGKAFLERYVQVEAARLNIPLENLADTCKKSVEQYNSIMKVIGSPAARTDQPR